MVQTNPDHVWKALADPTRRALLDALRVGPLSTQSLAASFPHLSRFAVMKHRDVLVEAALITLERRGRETLHHLNATALVEGALRWVEPHIAGVWAGRLHALKSTLEHSGGGQAMSSTLRHIDLQQRVTIAAPRTRVFDAIVRDTGGWWGAPYMVKAEPTTRIAFEPRVGGIFGEVWSNGSGQAFATVEAIEAPRLIQLNGRFMMPGAIAGWLRFVLDEEAGRTALTLTHQAVGAISTETEQGFGAGWRELLGERLPALVERGQRLGHAR